MSKKKNKKFKKNKSVKSTPQEINTTTFISSDPVVSEESISNGIDNKVTEPTSPKTDDPYSNNQYDHVKKDVKKILFIILILGVLFTGICLLGAKTNVLSSFGDWIYRVANIQTQ
ncbi:MAG: hypothetical protein WC536_02545 [Patescibacteria group bacterium]